MKSPGILKWQPSVSHWTSARLALARLFARQSSLLKVYSSCMRTVRLKTFECSVNWGEWAGGGGYPYLTRNFSSVRITIDAAPTCPPPVVGTLNRAWKNLWHPGYGRMRTTLRFPPSHHAQQSFNERRLRTIHSRLLSFKVRRKVCSLRANIYYFSLLKLETSAHRLGAGSYYICLRFHCCSDAVSRRTIIITTRFFVVWLF